MSTAVSTASSANPALSVPGSLAEQVGSYLISTNKNDVITKFTFQIYPWKEGITAKKSSGFGVPVVTHGQTLIFNTDQHTHYDRNLIFADYDLNVWRYSKDDVTADLIHDIQTKIDSKERIDEFPSILDDSVKSFNPKLLKSTHVVLTIDDRFMNGASDIINTAHSIMVEASGFNGINDEESRVARIQNSLNNLREIQEVNKQYRLLTEQNYSVFAIKEVLANLTASEAVAKPGAKPVEGVTPIKPDNKAKVSGRLSRLFFDLKIPNSKPCKDRAVSKPCLNWLNSADADQIKFSNENGFYVLPD